MRVTDTGTTVPYIVNSTISTVTVGGFGVTLMGSSPAIDSGQTETLTATAISGSPSYTYTWTGAGASVCDTTTASTTDVCPVSPTTSVPTTEPYSVSVTDSASHTQAASLNVQVNPAPTATFTPILSVLDSGEIETYQLTVNGGTGPFNVQLINMSGITPVPTGISTVILSPGGSGGLSFLTGAIGSFTYNAAIIDEGTTPNYAFITSQSTIKVNEALGSLFAAIPNSIDVGQLSTLTASIHGGTPPYTYNFIVVNSNSVTAFQQFNGPTSSQSSNAVFTATSSGVGPDNVYVEVRDSTSNPGGACTGANGCETLSNTMIVYALPAVTIPTNVDVDLGQTFTLSTVVVNPGSGTYAFQWYNMTSGNAITGATASTYSAPANSLGTFTYNVMITDSNNGMSVSNIATVIVSDTLGVSIAPSAASPVTGDSETLTASVSRGTAPFTYTFFNTTSGNALVMTGCTGNTCTFTTNALGSFSYDVGVTDNSAASPETANSAIASITVTSVPSGSGGGGSGGNGGGNGGGGGGGSNSGSTGEARKAERAAERSSRPCCRTRTTTRPAGR